jgi:HTH-like domain
MLYDAGSPELKATLARLKSRSSLLSARDVTSSWHSNSFCLGNLQGSSGLEAMISFIDDHRTRYGVEPICRVLPIAPSTYHAHAARRIDPDKASARARRDAVLRAQIRRVFDTNFGVYGARKIWRRLGRDSISVARCTVARLMRQMGRRGILRGKEIRTTIPDKARPCPGDRVNRQFRASRPNLLWLADFTYVATWKASSTSRLSSMPSPDASAGGCRALRGEG